MEQHENWQRALAKRVGEAVKSARGEMSAVELSTKCEKLGLPIHRTTLSKIEKGRSSFDLAELIVLARALDVPPLGLIYPDQPDGKVEVWPGTQVRSIDAAQWFSGEGGLRYNGKRDWLTDALTTDLPISDARRIEADHQNWLRAVEQVDKSRTDDAPDPEVALAQTLEKTRRQALAGRIALAILSGLSIDLGRYPDQIAEAVRTIVRYHADSDLDLFEEALDRGEDLTRGSDGG
ncbi:helix-turn-helix domain-containing protein [Gordonia sp. 4N]|uniref:helix-turn-helix domain-containing protein n=1 Tax=Gordonia sp. 4N TaxID=2993508 RepID=UPI00224886F8|nr:helix-turn-helix transcriptional regulator [Gordonia sp. 4N]MCX2755501.1 helix-turn-helix transcriptional regulator [Gordonia sp. 4N]